MHHLSPLAVLTLSALVTSCGEGPVSPRTLELGDTAQTRGTLLTSGESPLLSDLAWVPGTELIAFTTWEPAGRFLIKTVDAVSGSIVVVDSDAVSQYPLDGPYFSSLLAAPDGGALYYTVGIGDWREPEWQLRLANPAGGVISALRVNVGPALAVSPDGRYLAYVAWGSSRDYDSLIVRDLASGAERYYADYDGRTGSGGPITFSADGTALLYGQWAPFSWPLRRLSLSDGAGATVSLPDGVFYAQLFHWGGRGIEALAEVMQQYPSDYRVFDLTTGGSVQVGTIHTGQGAPLEAWVEGGEAWSADGTRVAYWIERCLQWAGFANCGVARYALFVADARTGSRVRVAYTDRGTGPTVFSPDGRRLVYHSDAGGEFYVVQTQ